MEPLVYIIVLNYRGADDTLQCVQSLQKIKYKNYSIVVVDNYSQDGSYDFLKENLAEDVVIVQTSQNNGYAYGNNIGIDLAIKNDAKFICIVNNDVVVCDDFLDILMGYMSENLNAGIVGPRICDYKNKNIIQSTGANINLYTGNVSPINFGRIEETVLGKRIHCDYMSGACMLVRSDLIEKIGLIPECYFLLFEETEWCIKTRKLKYEIVCVCDAKVIHKGSASIKKNISKLASYYFCRNLVLFERRNASNIQFMIFMIVLFVRYIYNILLRDGKIKDVCYYFKGLTYLAK